MKKLAIAVTLAAGLGIGSLAGVQAKLPPAAPMGDADKAAKAAKDAATKAKEGEDMAKAQDRAVANFKKNKGIAESKTPAKPSAASASGKK
ncbi:MAG: hypothetical protein ABI654_14695 [Betaproteobacteria bacterium]